MLDLSIDKNCSSFEREIQEYAELVAACAEFKMALGREEVNADAWACAVTSVIGNYGEKVDKVSEALQALCDIEPSKFEQE